MKIAIAGTGYVGLVTAACLADKGHDVTCVDVNEEKIRLLNEGIVPIYEPGLDSLIQRNGVRLRFTTNDVEAYQRAEVIMIAVGTPPQPDGSVRLDDVWGALRRIAGAAERDCLVVIKSTVPVGTGDEAARFLAENGRPEVKFDVVSNPEFLSQGTAVRDTLQAPRIVLGVDSDRAERVMKELYAPFALPYVVTDRRSAEMIKYAANVFLALKISYINEIANVCELVGADIQAVAEGIGMDPRIGRRFLRAGVGYGGSCLPKDANALYSLAASHGYSLKTVWAAIDVNEKQKWKLLDKARLHIGDFRNRTVAVLGAAFKPGTDDVRESPALANIERLISEGAVVRVWDPAALGHVSRRFGDAVVCCETIEEAIRGADVCFIFTEWPAVLQFDLHCYKTLMKTPLVVDGRNCYDPKAAEAAGLIYESIGRPVGHRQLKVDRAVDVLQCASAAFFRKQCE
ncbi:UDP-glucose 6-dehydrogenase [Geobacillus subterraneus]|uniref:UDP-glucose 6-dehydrogenase n=2 Tax=Geobacillus TaxID=129337 RepID=A0ABM6A7L4_9BACL|nr:MULTISPECIES: UDP-glucose/GDP-mannose dehydrogenase family protein [Geobacillus]AMX82215.1 UDP-glucose 6-dehydrogenase [Geobacillus subterraneus]AMX85150.1 UDP-glucose 6-dehydrogenase [Geobacillus subterraneus]KZS25650.1 UDP-glucose 6-dehydrogenase [Geobacillus subterraneus]OXB85354.1 UDP-glucose 6-dehydrogenase [Geobacillus uzenensis]